MQSGHGICIQYVLSALENNVPNSGVLFKVDTRSPNEIFLEDLVYLVKMRVSEIIPEVLAV